jgi:hypothetical protein
MLLVAAVALLLAQTTVADTLAPRADAYLDADARHMLALARERRESDARAIRGYRTVARERFTLGLRAAGRERLFIRRELAARIDWRRDGPGRVEVLGAREAMPAFSKQVRVPGDTRREVVGLAFDPAAERFFADPFDSRRKDVRTDSGAWLSHPLVTGSERDYRFRAGDTTAIRLADGSTVRLLELQVLPRRADPRLVRGSFWLDARTHAPVRAVFRLARALDLFADADLLDADDRDDINEVPRVLRPIRADLRLFTLEYGLWEGRWWLPRQVVFDAIAEVGMLPDVPLRFERAYSEYEVDADPPGAPLPPATDSAVITTCPKPKRKAAAPADSAQRDAPSGERKRGVRVNVDVELGSDSTTTETEPGVICTCTDGRCAFWTVELPADTGALLAGGGVLPPSIYADGETLVSGESVQALAEQLRRLAPAPWALGTRPTFAYDVASGDLVRYNRVEGLSLGARARVDYGGLAADLTARLGIADLEPAAELGVGRDGFSGAWRAAAYRRLAPVEAALRPLALGNSLNALLFGRDDGDYFRALGAELRGVRGEGAPLSYRWRLYAEQQRPAEKQTDWSVPYAFNRDNRFRANLPADRADQAGAELTLRMARGLDPASARWAAELSLGGEAGSYDFVRPALALSAQAPLLSGLAGAVEVAGGTSAGGALPLQSRYFLGGAATVRGYAPTAAHGEAFWRARAELGTDRPGARFIVFSDAGWAGARDAWQLDPPLLSAGAGVSVLDGMVRFDLARALKSPTGWRAEVYLGRGL